RERLSCCRIDQLDAALREVARAHRLGRHSGVLIEEIAGLVPRVVHLERRATVGVGIDAGDLERTSERRAEIVLCELRLGDRNLRAKLIGRTGEGRSAERVVDRSLIGTLRAPGAAAK